MSKNKFRKIVLDENKKMFVIHITFLSILYMAKKVQIIFLLTKKIKIQDKPLDYTDILLEEKAVVLLEIIDLNQHAIQLQKG